MAIISRSVCFDELGCFNNTIPYDNTGPVLPDAPSKINTQFMLITRRMDGEMNTPVLLNTDDLAASLADIAKKPLKIIVHGFSQSASADWIQPLVKAILSVVSTYTIADTLHGIPNYFKLIELSPN